MFVIFLYQFCETAKNCTIRILLSKTVYFSEVMKRPFPAFPRQNPISNSVQASTRWVFVCDHIWLKTDCSSGKEIRFSLATRTQLSRLIFLQESSSIQTIRKHINKLIAVRKLSFLMPRTGMEEFSRHRRVFLPPLIKFNRI